MWMIAAEAGAWHHILVDRTVEVGIVAVAFGVLACLIRLFRGPHLADRAIALDTIATQVIGLVILLTLRIDSLILFDGALVLSLVGFAGTVAVAQYIVRPHRRRRANPEATVKQDV
jgi:multicomponent K+:H+ antiporter subunit F